MIDFNVVPDEELFEMCIRGEEDAWRYIYNYILVICTQRRWELSEPDDIAQHITMHLIEKALEKLKEKNRFRNFVFVMACNKIKDCYKTQKIMVSIDQPQKNKQGEDYYPEYQHPDPLHDSLLISLEIVSIIDTALERLSSPCREILKEYFNYKLGIYEDYKELGEVLKMPVPTVSSRVTRCMVKFIEFEEIKALNR